MLINEQLFVYGNLAICLVGGWICMCRMMIMSGKRTKMMIRYQYAIWFSFFTVSGWSFLFGNPASGVQVLMSACVLAHLLIGAAVWRGGPPYYTRKEIT